MERAITIRQAKILFGENFIGPEEISEKAPQLKLNIPKNVPSLLFNKKTLEACAGEYLLILGISKFQNMKDITILSLRELFGINPEKNEPCFYNQDWYLGERFAQQILDDKWFLIRKNIYSNSRAQDPEVLCNKYRFPSAIQCAYAFFVTWFCLNECIWKFDYVWSQDTDVNGDRIYIGKYSDPNKINKNGFNIHRFLTIRDNYGGIDVL